MNTKYRPTRSLLAKIGLAAILVLLCLLVTISATADDRDLLRFNTAKPYLYIILDTSASMNLDFAGDWLPAGADNPQSRLYGAKEALYEVLLPITDVQYGFATFNQDKARVRSKHWRYAPQTDSTLFPFVYPNGEYWTLGEELDPTPFVSGHVGSCATPFDLAVFDDRQKVNTFPKIGEPPGSDVSTLWIADGGTVYQMLVSRSGVNSLGALTVDLRLEVSEVTSCSPLTLAPLDVETITFDLVREFLMMDDNLATATQPHGDELGGYWDYGDLLSSASCSSGSPFTGKGLESNYDSGVDLSFDPVIAASVSDIDQFCATGGPNSCYSLQQLWDGTAQNRNNEVVLDVTAPGSPAGQGYRALDYGDHIPLHWAVSYKDEVLSRLNPNHLAGVPNFGVASYFEDTRNNQTRTLRLRSPGRRPILAVGDSPIGKAVADFRCWYVGAGSNKCAHLTQFDPGWEDIALANDSEWGCRRPYLIVVSDGDDTCAGENPCADTANLFSKAQIRTWTFVTRPTGTASPPMTCMAQNGRGELIYVDSKQTLKDELNRILGEILEEARTFSSAAVPSAEAAVQDKIYTSRFVPLNGKSYWEGHLLSFLKPLPLDAEGKPDITSSSFLWDAGMAMLTQVDALDPLDFNDIDKRRVFYSREPTSDGSWFDYRRLLDPTTGADGDAVRYDLWRGMQLIDNSRTAVPDGSLPGGPPAAPNVTDTEARANAIIADVLREKSHDSDGDGVDDVFYILGDVFHSDPQVLGSPSDLTYFLQDLEGDGDLFDTCDTADKGYRCFFSRHEYRRKLAILGTNDGMMHFIDGGIFNAQRGGADEYTFDNGSGLELFAYMPREELVDAKRRANAGSHFFGVDGDPFITDVFIDPTYDGLSVNPDDREWRTVLIGSMREGGSSYFALDITQPDKVSTVSVQVDPFDTSITEDQIHPSTGVIPDCIEGGAGCGPVPFGSPLWEFTDSVWSPADGEYIRFDEDGNGQADLALTWSAATTGRIQVKEGGSDVDKYVAIFGGGMTPASKANPVSNRGDWIYMVDVETGKTIYKEQVDGAVPSDIAAVDTDLNGYIDRLYFGTLAGKVYRANIGELSSGDNPTMANASVTDVAGTTHTVERINHGGEWSPIYIFNANSPAGTVRPIYHEPSVIFVGKLNLFALAFGTGDREDLWATDPEPGHFFVFVDDSDVSGAPLPMDQGSLTTVNADDAYSPGSNYLENAPGQRGWVMPLEPNERVTAEAFSIAGVTVFTTYTPEIIVSGGRDPLCSKTGESRIFGVLTTNADGLFKNEFDIDTRHLSLAGTTTSPYTQTSQTGNTGTADVPPPVPPGLECRVQVPGSKPTQQTIQIWLSRGEGGEYQLPLTIPVCLLQKVWKEF